MPHFTPAVTLRAALGSFRRLVPRPRLRLVECGLLLSGVLACGSLSPRAAETSADLTVQQESLKGIDVDGKLHRLGAGEKCRAVTVLFLSTQCPISNGVIPTVSKLASRYRSKGVEFYGIVSSPSTTRAAARKHRDEYHIPFPVLFDASGSLRRSLKPTHTPQAIVLSPAGDVLYSGRIDDRYPAVGRKRTEATRNDLHDALAAIVAGRQIESPRTEPIGCPLEESPIAAAVGAVTYHRDIAPLILSHCAECHRPGEAGPFPLLTYDDACAHARQIANVTRDRIMPPWHAVSGFGRFRHERRLADDELRLIDRWVADGMPEGNPADTPPRPRFADGWRLGKPDLILKMPEAFELSADGADVHQHFVLPTGLRGNRLVSAIEFRPGNPRIVHHASFYIDTSGAARRLDSQDPGTGYGSFSGPGFENYGSFRSWLPGMSPERLPGGSGVPLPAHSDIVLEIHYQRSGKPESDQSVVGLYFAEPTAQQLVAEIQVMDLSLDIPAGAERHHHRASFTLPAAAMLLDAAPHMHLLGREMKATATLPNGDVVPLIWIQNWDFNWQGQYLYADPIRLPAGTRIDVDAWFDNSSANPLNPYSPPQRVRWGEQTKDEMGICHFRYTCDSLADLYEINRAYQAYSTRQHAAYHAVPAPKGN